MNIYVDLGCFDGDTVRSYQEYADKEFGKKDWKIYAFDANPKWQDNWVSTDNIKYDLKAAWIEDTELEFAVDQSESPQGSTLMPGKKAIWNTMPKIKVQAFDFSMWLKQFRDDLVVVKMDIEGAEFPILEKMIQDGTDTIPERMMIEFHPNKVVEYTTTDKNNLIDRLKSRGDNIIEWH